MSGQATFRGQPREREVSGLGDPYVRLAVNLYGAPALSLEEFAAYRQDLIVGASVAVGVPLGQYESNKLVNIGTNRWSFKPEIGLSKAWGPITLELAAGATFFTANDDFLVDQTLERAPLYSLQAHLIYSFPFGIWAAANAVGYRGGRTTVDGVRGEDLQENVRVGLTVSFPVTRHSSIKLYGSTGAYARTGTNFNTGGILWQLRWGGGLQSETARARVHRKACPRGDAESTRSRRGRLRLATLTPAPAEHTVASMRQAPLTLRRWTRAEYDRLVEMGLLDREPVELIAGQLVVAEPHGSYHASTLGAAGDGLRALLPAGWLVRVQLPVALDDESEPEPDLALVPGAWADYRAGHPARPALVIEVAESSLAFDRGEKGSLYARGGVSDYWIVNLVDGVLEVYRDPSPDPAAPFGWRYRLMERLARDAVVSPLALPSVRVEVRVLLP